MVRDQGCDDGPPDRPEEANAATDSGSDSRLAPPPGDATRILSRIEAGDPSATDELLPLVYDELRKLAARQMAREAPGQTLQPTALVHEAYLRLVGGDHATSWTGRRHFFCAAAQAMRQILVDAARRKKGPKHGGYRCRVELDERFYVTSERARQLIALEQALEKLAADSPKKAEFVKLRYFAGLSHQQAAAALGISRATADRYWAYAKAFLYCEVAELTDF